ncbi:MAG: DUF362 domain-containing protein [Bacteroidia bacterium]|nr:DUF362 domain-containing protein [Bacteroidia bacterium]
MEPIVVVEKGALDGESMIKQFSASIKTISLDEAFSKANAVFIKPNLTYPTYKKGVTTRVEFIESLVAALRQINSTTKIYLGEGEGGYNSFSMTEAMKQMGFFEIAKRYPNVEIVNLSAVKRVTVQIIVNNKPYSLELPELFFNEIDFSISCPLPKVHCMTGITISLKNQWGCLPDTMRLKNHYVFDEIINQVCEKLKFRYAFLDGKFGLDTNGPMNGDPVEVNWFAASNSLGAMDIIISEMMGFDWQKVGHLKMAERYGYMPKREDIKILGNTDALKRKFTLRRNFWNYPALVAFHSKNLTTLFYLSRWAKLLHDIMYSIRKRPLS